MKGRNNGLVKLGTNFNETKRNSGVNNSAILSHGTWKASQGMHLNLANDRANPIRTSYNTNWKKNTIGGNTYKHSQNLNMDLNQHSIAQQDPNFKFPNI